MSHISNVRPDPDRVLVDIVDYVLGYTVDSTLALDTARNCTNGRMNTRPFLHEGSRPLRIVVDNRIDSVFESQHDQSSQRLRFSRGGS